MTGYQSKKKAAQDKLEQEPVGKFAKFTDGVWREVTNGSAGIPLYTAPPQRPWVGLEGEEIRNLWEEAAKPDRSTMAIVTSFARAIEAKLKEKNNG